MPANKTELGLFNCLFIETLQVLFFSKIQALKMMLHNENFKVYFSFKCTIHRHSKDTFCQFSNKSSYERQT